MKPVQFQGVRLISGEPENVMNRMAGLAQQNIASIGFPPVNGKGIFLDNEDAAAFLKDNYDVEMPQELFNKGPQDLQNDPSLIQKAQQFVGEMQSVAQEIAQNPQKVLENIVNYVSERVEAGADAAGNPIEREEV